MSSSDHFPQGSHFSLDPSMGHNLGVFAMPDNYHSRGPYVLWIDQGYEGWRPRSYDTLLDAVNAERYGSDFVITRVCKLAVVDLNDPTRAVEQTTTNDVVVRNDRSSGVT